MKKRIGVIGFGARAQGLLRNLTVLDMNATVTAVADPAKDRVIERLKSAGFDPEQVKIYETAEEMLDREQLDAVMVSTRCDFHVQHAKLVMARNLPMLLEKPVAINEEQLAELEEAAKTYTAPSLISFPLRGSYLLQAVKKVLDRGELGKISHVEAVNNVSYGRTYYKDWYRDDSITGGLFLQKATHDLDYINYLFPSLRPVEVCAMESKRIFKGDKPKGTTCDTCAERDTCKESTKVLHNDYHKEDDYGTGCSFAVDTGNHDSASILVMYDDGMHAVYTQDFVARKGAAKRGARIIGQDGTIEFDWITGEYNLYDHRDPRTTTCHIGESLGFHYGGDKALCESLMAMLDGGESLAPLETGLLSARMCLAAKRSALTHTFQTLE